MMGAVMFVEKEQNGDINIYYYRIKWLTYILNKNTA